MRGIVPYQNRVRELHWFPKWETCLFRIDKQLSDVWVYFMFTNCGFIKIGKTTTPDRRYRQLINQSPPNVTLGKELLINESVMTEDELKAKFADWYHPGEWYDEVEEVVSFVEQLRQIKIQAAP